MSGETFGGMGKLEWSQGSPDDPNPVWTDITVYLRTEDTPLQITRGRQSELDSIQSSQLTCVLDNTDNRFTPGYTLGPYGSNWTSGKKLRYSETLAGVTLILYTGYLEFPDIDDWQPIGLQFVQLTAVDRLTRLQRGKPFISTLGAHILGVGPAAGLKAYYSMGGSAAPFLDESGNAYPAAAATLTQSSAGGTISGAPSVTATSVAGPAGDDQSAPAFTFATTDFFGPPPQDVSDVKLIVDFQAVGQAISIPAGQVLTVVAWVNADVSQGAAPAALLLSSFVYQSGSFFAIPATIEFNAAGTTNGGNWFCAVSGAADLVGTKAVSSHWLPIAYRIAWSPSQTVEFWQADQPAQSEAWVGGPPANLSLGQLYILQAGFAGAIEHVQIYVGDPTLYTRTQFLAQMQVGLTGLEYQTTGQRINTILNYAGVPGTDQVVDPGVDFLQRATLAAQTPADALQTAVDTERARAFIDGQGRYVFQDRNRTYNV